MSTGRRGSLATQAMKWSHCSHIRSEDWSGRVSMNIVQRECYMPSSRWEKSRVIRDREGPEEMANPIGYRHWPFGTASSAFDTVTIPGKGRKKLHDSIGWQDQQAGNRLPDRVRLSSYPCKIPCNVERLNSTRSCDRFHKHMQATWCN